MTNLIHHPLLGSFKRTGTVRKPRIGEYYMGPISKTICLAAKDATIKAEILERVAETVEVK